MESKQFLTVLTAIAIVLATVAFFVSDAKISGHVVQDNATVNLTIVSVAALNFTTDSVNWGSGAVDIGEGSATIDTLGTVTRGNWSAVSQGLVLENIGNVNLSVTLSSSNNGAANFIGGTSPTYDWRITNSEASSCNGTATVTIGTWYAASSSLSICDVMEYTDVRDEVTIDINITIPSDSLKGVRSDIVTATGTAL